MDLKINTTRIKEIIEMTLMMTLMNQDAITVEEKVTGHQIVGLKNIDDSS